MHLSLVESFPWLTDRLKRIEHSREKKTSTFVSFNFRHQLERISEDRRSFPSFLLDNWLTTKRNNQQFLFDLLIYSTKCLCRSSYSSRFSLFIKSGAACHQARSLWRVECFKIKFVGNEREQRKSRRKRSIFLDGTADLSVGVHWFVFDTSLPVFI